MKIDDYRRWNATEKIIFIFFPNELGFAEKISDGVNGFRKKKKLFMTHVDKIRTTPINKIQRIIVRRQSKSRDRETLK